MNEQTIKFLKQQRHKDEAALKELKASTSAEIEELLQELEELRDSAAAGKKELEDKLQELEQEGQESKTKLAQLQTRVTLQKISLNSQIDEAKQQVEEKYQVEVAQLNQKLAKHKEGCCGEQGTEEAESSKV